jgi:putative ABC transport system permease protein
MRDLVDDVRFALRQLARSPGFTACAILSLALGIGVNTAIFSVVYGVLLRALPYAHGDELLHLGQLPSAAQAENVNFSVPELRDLAAQSRALAGVVEYHSMPFTLLGRGEPDRAQIAVVSAGFFQLFGVQPVRGRVFLPEDEKPGCEPVLVLTNEYWRRRFGGDPQIVGRSLRLNGKPITVVGVLPPLPRYPGKNDAFMPTVACPIRSSERLIHNRRARMLSAFARLAPGTTEEMARADLATLSARMRLEHPEDYKSRKQAGLPFLPVREELTGGFRPLVLLLLGTVGLVLLVACANVANLVLARQASREQELGMRAALGAGRGRLARQLLTESTVLAFAGGAVGVLLAASGVRLLVAFASRFTVRTGEIGIAGPVLLFTLGLSLLTGLAVGLAPVLRTSPRRLAAALRAGGVQATPGRARLLLRDFMMVVQVAVSFVLLVGAGLLLRTFLNLQGVDPGFARAGVVTMELPLPVAKYRENPEVLEFFDRLFAALRRLPAVRSVAAASDLPLTERPYTPGVKVEGRDAENGEAARAGFHLVSEDYFRTLGISLLRGRSFAATDVEGSPPVAVISRSMASRFWPDADPLGKRFSIPSQFPDWWTVVGIVEDVKQYGLDAESGPGFYLPFRKIPGGGQVLVRTESTSGELLRSLKAAVHAIDPEQPVVGLQTLEQVRADWLAPSRLTAVLAGFFSVLALVLAALGVGSVVAFGVAERTHEIGIRTALGSSAAEIVGLILRRALPLLAAALALGLLGSLSLTRLVAGLLFGVAPQDPATLAAAGAVLAATFVLCALVPARRAARIDPVLALRE